MYPGCRFMDLHPRERAQMSYAPHHFPGYGHVSPEMKMDTARPPVNYESFPYGSYGCPYPLPYHGCYHNQIPDYNSYGLHYPHYAPPPPLYCHGSYPPLPGYLPSSHYYAADPRYEYDKKGPVDHHCCGCPNHLCQQNENKNVKIEEHTSDDEKDRVASLVPSELKGQPYPVLWIPPGHTSNGDGEQTINPESKRETSFDKEAKGCLKPCAQEPSVWNRWLPLDLNKLNSLVPGRDEKGTEHQQNEDSKSLFPLMDKLELKDGDQKSIWDPSQYKIFPLKFIENQDKKSMPKEDAENIENSSSEDGPKTRDKNVVKKIIPVKQMDQSEEKVLLKDDQTEKNRAKVEKSYGEMPLKHTNKKGEKEHLENNRSVQSSLSKASKLPPICLRVDPLPSRKTKGGSSRSPSPPANKKKSEMLSDDKSTSSSTTQENNQQDMQSSTDSNLGRLQSGKKIKDIEVFDNTTRDNKIEAQKEGLSQSLVNALAGESQEKVASGCQDGKGVKSDQEISVADGVPTVDKLSGEITKDDKITIETQSGDTKCETGANEGPVDTKISEPTSTNGAPDQKLSQAEAAAIIQSAYRGFEVRRWEPLKKLKEIARIEGELSKVRLDVQNLVSSGSGNIDKQKIVIGETIMNLLLQLDTMQGLHPSMRNIRKSVAKELVSLQEKIDSITSQKSEELKESDISTIAVEISKSSSEEERQEAGEDIHEKDTTSPSHMKSGVTKPCQDQPHTLLDVNISSVDTGKSELLSGTDEMGMASEKQQPDSLSSVDLNGRQPEPLVEVKAPSEVHGVCEDRDYCLVESKELPPILAEPNHVVQLQNLSSQVDSDWSSKEDEVVNTDVPPQVQEQIFTAQVSGEGLQIDGQGCTVEPGKPELVQESGQISVGNKANETSAEEQQAKLLAKSPKSPDLEDNVVTSVCSEGSSELKDDIIAEGDSDRDKEISGDDMLGAGFVDPLKEKHVNNIEEEENDCVVERDDKSTDDMRTAAVRVDTKDISDINEVANACEVEGEVDDKPDMHIADSVQVEAKETPDIKAAVDVCGAGGDVKPVDDMQTADTVGLEQRETQEVNEFGMDVGPVEGIESIETCGPKLEDLSTATSDLQVKPQNLSCVKDTVSGEEVHMKEIGNCNSEQKTAVDEDQEMWEDKFDNKEINQKHSDGDISDLPRDKDFVEEKLATEKVNKQPHGELSTGEGDFAGEELFAVEPCKEVLASLPVTGQISSGTKRESEKELVEENEKLKETVEKLIAAGKEQLTAISSLSERVKDLEKKFSRKKKLKMRKNKSPRQYLVQV